MFQAQMLIRGASTDTKVFSPWMDRQGDYVRATSEFVAGNGELTVAVDAGGELAASTVGGVPGIESLALAVGRYGYWADLPGMGSDAGRGVEEFEGCPCSPCAEKGAWDTPPMLR